MSKSGEDLFALMSPLQILGTRPPSLSSWFTPLFYSDIGYLQCCDDFSCVCLTFLTAYLSTWHNMSMCRIAWRSCGTASSTSCSHCFRIRGCCSRPAHPSSRRPYSTTAPKFDFSARWSTVLCFYSYLFTELTLLCVVETESRWQGRVKDFSLGARSKSGGEVVGEGNNTNHQRYQVLKQSNT